MFGGTFLLIQNPLLNNFFLCVPSQVQIYLFFLFIKHFFIFFFSVTGYRWLHEVTDDFSQSVTAQTPSVYWYLYKGYNIGYT